MTIVPRILRFCLPLGTAFVICGIHQIVPLLEGIFEISFSLLRLIGIYKAGESLHCTPLPFMEDEEIAHPHDLSEELGFALAEDILSAIVVTIAILLYWIGFLFKGSKACLLSWIVLSGVALVFRGSYYLRHNNSEEYTSSIIYAWPAFQIIIASIRYIYMALMGIFYLRNSRGGPEPFADDDLKPIGIGAISLFRYYCNVDFLRDGLLALATAPLLDTFFFYLFEMPAKMVDGKDIIDVVLLLIVIEAIPYILLIIVLNVTAVKWVEYWRSGYLTICFLWGLIIIGSIIFSTLSCGFEYYLNAENAFNTFIILYIMFYKCFLHRFSLLYVKKFRNSSPLEMADVHIANDLICESRAPFASSYDC